MDVQSGGYDFLFHGGGSPRFSTRWAVSSGGRRVRVQLAADVEGDDSYTQENHVVLLEVSEVFETLFR